MFHGVIQKITLAQFFTVYSTLTWYLDDDLADSLHLAEDGDAAKRSTVVVNRHRPVHVAPRVADRVQVQAVQLFVVVVVVAAEPRHHRSRVPGPLHAARQFSPTAVPHCGLRRRTGRLHCNTKQRTLDRYVYVQRSGK